MKTIKIFKTNISLITFTLLILIVTSCTKDFYRSVSVTTKDISSVTGNTATATGRIIDEGEAGATQHGHCWDTITGPTVLKNKTELGSTADRIDFTSYLTNLTPNTKYYVRSYATDKQDNNTPVYGTEINFTTGSDSQVVVLPTVTTTAISSITQTTASSGGNVTDDGGASVSARGICWSTSQNPIVTGSHTSNGTGTGSFISSITGLTNNTKYYVRAYATNSVGTAYGNEVSFTAGQNITSPVVTTTAVSNITQTTATSGGNVTSDGGASVTAKGVCWSTSQNPIATGNHTSDGTGTGSFTSSITGLTANTTYYVRAYATNSAGTSYGNQINFTTPASITAPTVTTTAVSSITHYTAISGGNVTSDGGATITARGVCWSYYQNPIIANDTTFNGTGTGAFLSNLTGLADYTTYYIRAYATNSMGTAYGNEISFTTSGLPIVTTSNISSISVSNAIGGGNVTYQGPQSVTARGVCWSTSSNPTINNFHTNNGINGGVFQSGIDGLNFNTTYYVRAYATNNLGTGYGNEVSFTTNIPVVLDIDGNGYDTVHIGSQIWLKQNLKTTKYKNGSAIPKVTDASWSTIWTPAYCWFNNDSLTNKDPYGALYNWYVVETGNLCPNGWHVPSDTEWTTLTDFLGGLSIAGGKLKEAGTIHWSGSNVGATNETNFTALPGGYCSDAHNFGSFNSMGNWWGSTNSGSYPLCRNLRSNNGTVTIINNYHARFGLSVRCLKD